MNIRSFTSGSMLEVEDDHLGPGAQLGPEVENSIGPEKPSTRSFYLLDTSTEVSFPFPSPDVSQKKKKFLLRTR